MEAALYVLLDNVCWKGSRGAWQRVKLLLLCGRGLCRCYCPWSSF